MWSAISIHIFAFTYKHKNFYEDMITIDSLVLVNPYTFVEVKAAEDGGKRRGRGKKKKNA